MKNSPLVHFDNDYLLNINNLQDKVKGRYKRPISSVKDFEFLAEEVNISAQTLRRFFGKIDFGKKLSTTSLDIISIYAGYDSWEHFCNQPIQNISNETNEILEIIFTFFSTLESSKETAMQKSVFDTAIAYSKYIVQNENYMNLFLDKFQNSPDILQIVMSFHPYYDCCALPGYIQCMEKYISIDDTPHIQVSMNSFLAFGAFLAGEDSRFYGYFEKAKFFLKEMRNETLHYWPEIRFVVAEIIDAYLRNEPENYAEIVNRILKNDDEIFSKTFPCTKDRPLLYTKLIDIFIWIDEIEWANKIKVHFDKRKIEFDKIPNHFKISKKYTFYYEQHSLVMMTLHHLDCINGNSMGDFDSVYNAWENQEYNRVKELKIKIMNAKTLKDKKDLEKELKMLCKKLNFNRIRL